MGVHGRQNTIKSLEFNAAAWKDGRWEKPTPWQERGGYGPAPHSLGWEWWQWVDLQLSTSHLSSSIEDQSQAEGGGQNPKCKISKPALLGWKLIVTVIIFWAFFCGDTVSTRSFMMSVWAPNNRPCVPAIVSKSQAAAVRKQLMGSNTRGKI